MYLGRVVAIGQTTDGKHMAAYAVSGRSPGSQARKLIFDNDVIKIAKFIPGHFTGDDKEKCEKMWQEQKENLLYTAAKVTKKDNILVVTNGYQTDLIAEAFSDNEFSVERAQIERIKLMKEILGREGPETDPSQTPRIAGFIEPSNPYFALGIVTKKGARAVGVLPQKGYVRVIATYQKNPSTADLIGPELDTLGTEVLNMDGLTPDDLAEEFMGWLNKQKDGKVEVISSAGMVYNNSELRWEFKERNLWGD